MVTTNHNSQVKVFVKTTDNKTVSKVVRKKSDVDNLANVATQKRNLVDVNESANSNTDVFSKNKKRIKGHLKNRLQTLVTPDPETMNQSSTPDGNEGM